MFNIKLNNFIKIKIKNTMILLNKNFHLKIF